MGEQRLWRSLLQVCAALALVCPTGTRAQPTSAETAERAIAEINSDLIRAQTKGYGGAVIIEQDGKTLLSKGYGLADRKHRRPFTPDTIAQIGSITKSQTGAALATLIAEGKVSLSDPVSKFIPEAPEPGRSRTISQLASHRSGLLDACTEDFEPQSEAMLIRTCLAKPLAHAPGEENYSNMGYSVLALIIERATGKQWEEVLRQRVWRPLAMRDIGFYFGGRSSGRMAFGYLRNVKQPVISGSIASLHGKDWAVRGNGGIQASAQTMIRFLDGILDPKGALAPSARRLILAPLPGQAGDEREGFGFAFRYDGAGKLVRMGHSGSDGVFFSYLCWLPDNDVRFYFVGNNGEGEVKPVLQQVLKAAMRLPPTAAGGGL